MKITDLKVNHISQPIGYMLDTLSLSWITCETVGKRQAAARIEISKNENFEELIYDSGKDKDLNSASCKIEVKLEPCTRYFWRVTVWTEKEETADEISYFETGKMFGKFEACWIKAPFDKNVHPVFFKAVSLPDEVVSAKLYITALGLYEAEINGEKVGNEYLAPFYTDYSNWLQYQTYDVTKNFTKGENVIGVMLGNGWYKGRFSFVPDRSELYGEYMELLAEIRITLKNSETLVVGTDESWLCASSPIVDSSIYDGEIWDANREIANWSNISNNLNGYVPSVLGGGYKDELTERLSPPLTIVERIKPIELIHTPTGEIVIDFGQILSGWVEFDVNEKLGTEIFLQHGEILQEGNFYNTNLRSAKAEYTYISNGRQAHVRPHFTFYGFRFVKVNGIENINLDNFIACVIHSDIEMTGEIETSNEKVNRLFKNAMWGQRGNFLDVPTDCPQRDERMGWTGDAQVFCATASFNMYTPAFYKKYLYDMLLEQRQLGGSVPFVVPDTLGQIAKVNPYKDKLFDKSDGSCAWGDAATVIPYTSYLFYGDKQLLAQQYENMKAWTDYIKNIDDTECGGARLWKTGFHFADWLALDNIDKESPFGGTDVYYVASAYYLYSARLTSEAAGEIGNTDEQIYYSKLAEEIEKAIQQEYFTETGRIAIDTQTAMVLALYFNFVPVQHKARLIEDLKQKLDKSNVHLTTGFVGTPYLCPSLSQNGLNDYAYTLLLNEDYPSWLYEVNMGATTIWERWNSVLPNGKISETGMNSLNHYAYGAIAEWMYRYMCGLNPVIDEPAFKKFTIKPYTDKRIGKVQMKYKSAYGKIVSGWEFSESGDKITYNITVPFNSIAEFALDKPYTKALLNGKACEELAENGRIPLEAGEYEIVCT